jgi:Transposase and inactivated derivatives
MPAHLYATNRMKYEAIRTHRQEFAVGKMCKALNLTSGAYYQWVRRAEAKEEKQAAEQKIVNHLIKVFEENRRTYGYRRMWRAMKEIGFQLSEYKVRSLMRSNGLYPVTALKFRPTHNGEKTGKFLDNKVAQEFMPEGFNEIWVGDITYIKTELGWVYLAIVMDLYNREIIGYSIDKSIDTELVKRSLSNALSRRGGGEGTMFHSDRGVQYCSKGFQKMLADHGMSGSMSRPGCPYDNACAESFFSTAKRECIYRKKYATVEEVKADMFEYIEVFYNRKRMHKTLGYQSPIAFRLLQTA